MKRLARRYHRPGIDLQDLVSEGNIGLIKAMRRHNPKKGALSTIAVPHIESRIRRFAQQSHLVRVPERRLQKQKGSAALPVTIGGLKGAKLLGRRSTTGGIPHAEAKTDVGRLLRRLAPDERRVLQLRHLGGASIAQVAKRLKKSPSTIHAIERRAFAKARRDSMRPRKTRRKKR